MSEIAYESYPCSAAKVTVDAAFKAAFPDLDPEKTYHVGTCWMTHEQGLLDDKKLFLARVPSDARIAHDPFDAYCADSLNMLF